MTKAICLFFFITIQKTFEEELFQGEEVTYIEKPDHKEQIPISGGNYHIKNSYFHDITSTSQGGAFSLVYTNGKILIS